MRISLYEVEYEKNNEQIIRGISWTFTPGITYVVGKNGAGKSSLLHLLSTAKEPTKGKIEYTSLTESSLYPQKWSIEEVRMKIGFLPQHFTGYQEMTVQRYLKYMALHKGIPSAMVQTTMNQWLEKTNLDSIKRKKLKFLSGGQLKKVGLIQAMINQPRICILDEPFEGLDLSERLLFGRMLQRLSFHSIVIVSTHLIEELLDGDLLFLVDGRPLFFGEVAEAKATRVLNDLR